MPGRVPKPVEPAQIQHTPQPAGRVVCPNRSNLPGSNTPQSRAAAVGPSTAAPTDPLTLSIVAVPFNDETHPAMTPYGAPQRSPIGLGQRVRNQARRGFRTFGGLTAPLRMDPDYLIIGTKRGGTTSLAQWLLDHPDVRPLYPAAEHRKGTYFFDVNYSRGHQWYRSHFPTGAAHRLRSRNHASTPLIGDATPYYLHHPHAADRAREHAPNAKVIALLRNPVDRAYGHWAERSRNGIETLPFSEAIRAEAGRLAGEEQRMFDDPSYVSFAHQHYSYADQSRYARGLARWLDAYPGQVLVLKSEDLYISPATTYAHVLNFLDLASHDPAEFVAWNYRSKDPIAPEDRLFLVDALAEDVAQLEALLGRSKLEHPSLQPPLLWEGFD